MGTFDELKKKSKDLMNNSDAKAKIEKMAKEKGISIDKAKEYFTKRNKQ